MLQEALHQLLNQTIGFLTIMNPIAGAAMMITLSGNATTAQEVELTARKTTFTVLIALLVTIGLGEMAFNFFGINTYSIEAIGGIIILRMALNMIEGKSSPNHSPAESKEAFEKEDISVIPLGIPIFFGPGAIATTILFKSKSTSLVQIIILLLAVLLSLFIVYLALRNAKWMSQKLGVTGMKIATRVLGLILGAIAVQFILTGVHSLWTQFSTL